MFEAELFGDFHAPGVAAERLAGGHAPADGGQVRLGLHGVDVFEPLLSP